MKERDVVVVGAGAAGVSCALECFDVRLDTLVLEAAGEVGGQVGEIPHSVRNVAAGRFADGDALRRGMEQSAAILGDRLHLGARVTAIDLGERWVEVDGARVAARALVLATGARRQELAGAPHGAFGGDVSYQVESQPGYFRGRDVVVIGGGDSGTLDALELARDGSAVTLVHRGRALTARDDIVAQVRDEPRITDLPGWELDALEGGARLEAVVLVNGDGERRRIAVGGLVVKIARVPRTELFAEQLELDRRGAVVVDAGQHTSRPGVMAVGDVVSDAYPRVAAAMGQGMVAARSVLRHLQGRA